MRIEELTIPDSNKTISDLSFNEISKYIPEFAKLSDEQININEQLPSYDFKGQEPTIIGDRGYESYPSDSNLRCLKIRILEEWHRADCAEVNNVICEIREII